MAEPDDKFTGDPVDASSPGLRPSYGPGDRFSQPDDKIDAIPGILIDNKIEAGGGQSFGDMSEFKPNAEIAPAMAEAKAFHEQDKQAMTWLTKFLTEADTGFRVYHGTAKNHGQDYISTDQVGASFFQNIDKKKAPESYFNKDVTSDIYA